jgi:hypothetical protein
MDLFETVIFAKDMFHANVVVVNGHVNAIVMILMIADVLLMMVIVVL